MFIMARFNALIVKWVLLGLCSISIVVIVYLGIETNPSAVSNRSADAAAGALNCGSDLDCFSASVGPNATKKCKIAVQRAARYSVRWSDDVGVQLFSVDRWIDQARGIVELSGDRMRMNNSLGFYERQRYSCSYDALNDNATVITISPYTHI